MLVSFNSSNYINNGSSSTCCKLVYVIIKPMDS